MDCIGSNYKGKKEKGLMTQKRNQKMWSLVSSAITKETMESRKNPMDGSYYKKKKKKREEEELKRRRLKIREPRRRTHMSIFTGIDTDRKSLK